jgi:S1-C subfamily serine protease
MVAPLPARLFRELEIRLVYQRRRRQGAALATVAITAREPKVRDSTKLVIGERDDFIQRFLRGVVSQHGFPLRLNERARAVTTTVPTYAAFRGGDSRAAFIHLESEA